MFAPIANAVAYAMGESGDCEEVTEAVMRCLHDHGYLTDYPKGVPLLMTTGRLFCLVALNPEITLREAAARLGVTESNTQRAMTSLMQDRLVARTSLGGKYRYEVDLETARNHPDIRMMFAVSDLLA